MHSYVSILTNHYITALENTEGAGGWSWVLYDVKVKKSMAMTLLGNLSPPGTIIVHGVSVNSAPGLSV